jgi:hypothetical protein
VVLLSVTIAAVVVVQDWQKVDLRASGWLLGPTLLGILNRRLRGETFLKFVYASLICVGIVLLIQAVRGV